MEPDGFHDRNQRYGYLVARENARRIAADPAVAEAGRRHLEAFSARDPSQRDGALLWRSIFAAGSEEVVRRLLDRSPDGDYARQTAPSFGALPPRTRARLLRLATEPLAPASGGEAQAGCAHLDGAPKDGAV